MKCIIYHNQKCSKSRETLELLQNRGLDPTIIEYLKNSPKVDELEKIISKLKILIKNPELIERPIVVTSKGAVIGRPPENVLKLLD